MEMLTINEMERPAATWHAIYTRHQHEKAVAHSLSGKRFDVFLPLYASNRRWKDRVARVSLPLFPGYVFFRGCGRRLEIVSTPGVHCVLTVGGRLAEIPDQEIEAVRRVVESKLPVEPYPFLRCGDRIRITSGPLAGAEGILARKKNLFRLVLSVELLERSIAVEVDGSAVEAVPHRSSVAGRRAPFDLAPRTAWM